MTSISWPIRLSGDYSDGTVCNAADYKNDFGKLRDAVNQLYERFGSYRISAHVKRPFGFTGDTNEYLTLADSASVGTAFHMEGTGVGSLAEAATRVTSTLIKVPAWMQGVRIRGIHASNTTNLPFDNNSSGVYPGGTHDADIRWVHKAPTVGVSVASSLAGFRRDTNGGYDDAVDVQSIVFGGNGDSDVQLNDVAADVRASGYTDKGEVGGINWSTPAGATQLYQPVFMEAAADYVVEPGTYIALWCAGSVKYSNSAGDTDPIQGPFYLEYSWDVLLDAMIPIP